MNDSREVSMKRFFDIVFSVCGLILLSPLLLIVMLLIWLHDSHSPFYIAPRVGKNGQIFQMVKFRSMIVDADKTGVDSTSSRDPRITPIGHFVRKFKLDEFTQLWNVLMGNMSLVGPRPNVKRETDLYTPVEKRLLSVQPGITDLSSIVFSDENDILKNSEDPDIDYNQLIRPWKSRLGLLYIDNITLGLDFRLIFLTIVNMYSRPNALRSLNKLLKEIDAPEDVIRVSKRHIVLVPFPPPGSDRIVIFR
jgi:lipopolysaccharide/colanic/teichoic acid biosynthesis glycosyltransferase